MLKKNRNEPLGAHELKIINARIKGGDFPGGPVVKTPHSHFRGRRFDPWPGN